MKYNVFSQDGSWLGAVNAESEIDALAKAKAEGMTDADRVEENDTDLSGD